MARLVLFLAVLISSTAYAADSEPVPIRRWLISTHKTLAREARDNPLSQYEKMWDKLSECGPDRPIEIRAKVSSMRWADGVLSFVITEPLGWYKRKDTKPPKIDYMRTYYVRVTEEEALKLRTGTFVIIEADVQLFSDQSEYRLKHNNTHRVLFTVSTGNNKLAYYASDAIDLKIDGVKYPVIYDK